MSDLHAGGVRVLGYVNPFLVETNDKPGVKRNRYEEARAQGLFVTKDDGSPYPIQNTDFAAGILDFTNPAATTWMKAELRAMLDLGFSGWMADYGEALPFEGKLASGVSGSAFHNAYPAAWAAVNRAALKEAGAEGDTFFFSRSGSRNSPGISDTFWLGDQTVTWDEHDGLKSAMIGLLSGGFSGITINHGDVGGYVSIGALGVVRTKELLARWEELGAFTAIFRTHEGNEPANNAQAYSDDETLTSFARAASTYKALGAYRKAVVTEASTRGVPVDRHLWIHYPSDPEVRKFALNELEMLLGADVLVAPVLDAGATARRVYFPKGEWVHLYTGARYGSTAAGVWADVDAPLGTPPAFVRAAATTAPSITAAFKAAGLGP